MKARCLAAVLLAVITNGCVRYTPHPIDPAATAERLEKRSLAPKVWSLEALREEALHVHPSIAVARAQLDAARAALLTAGELPNPTLSLTPQVVTPYTALISGTYGIDLDFPIETAGKRSHRKAIARSAVVLATTRLTEAQWKIRASVRKAFLDLYAAQTRGRLLNEAIARQDELLKALDARIAAGEEPRSASAQPRIARTQLRLQAADTAKNEALAVAALAEAVGVSSRAITSARFSFTAFERFPSLKASVHKEALTHRADVLAALAEYAVTEASLRLEVARQYPDLHLAPGYQLDAGENKWGLGIGLTLPILNQNRGPIAEAEAKRTESAAKFDVVQSAALAECDRATALVKATRKKKTVAEELLASQNQILASETKLVEAGEGDRLALLSARVEQAVVRALRFDAIVELQAAIGSLEEAVQSTLAK